ncbi:MAG: sulfotransferase [Pirellulales bacterium]|nr:sulfotransferase [Pirellulales bacterium]
MSNNNRPSNIQHPLALGSMRNWLRLLWANGGVEKKYLPRAGFVSSLSALTIPLRIYERIAYRRVIENVSLDKPPVFIVGHWRSGTTPLHLLLCSDSTMGYVSTFQSIAPEWFITGNKYLKGMVAKLIPSKRMMDNIRLSLDDPQEDELAMAEASPYSFYHQWSFPRAGREYFEKYVLFRNVPDDLVDRWKRLYMNVLCKATHNHGGKRLIIKNPANSARIKNILELFPDARFINIYRNPYVVFLSTKHFFRSILAIMQLKDIDDEELDSNILWYYEQLMKKYLTDKDMIPAENLIDIRFEDFEADPLREVRRIYGELDLQGFAAAEPEFREHLASLAGYQKNHYEIDSNTIRKVQEHWGFAIDRWGYKPPVVESK